MSESTDQVESVMRLLESGASDEVWCAERKKIEAVLNYLKSLSETAVQSNKAWREWVESWTERLELSVSSRASDTVLRRKMDGVLLRMMQSKVHRRSSPVDPKSYQSQALVPSAEASLLASVNNAINAEVERALCRVLTQYVEFFSSLVTVLEPVDPAKADTLQTLMTALAQRARLNPEEQEQQTPKMQAAHLAGLEAYNARSGLSDAERRGEYERAYSDTLKGAQPNVKLRNSDQPAKQSKDPVFKGADGLWYFWDESWSRPMPDMGRGYADEAAARTQMAFYSMAVLGVWDGLDTNISVVDSFTANDIPIAFHRRRLIVSVVKALANAVNHQPALKDDPIRWFDAAREQVGYRRWFRLVEADPKTGLVIVFDFFGFNVKLKVKL